MKVIPTTALALALLAGAHTSFSEADAYVPGPDSLPQLGVPQGELIKFDFQKSRIYPGTTRSVTVYVPKEYDPATPACVYVDQDGIQFKAPTVLDNLIARKEVPVIIGVFVTPGVVLPHDPKTELTRYNRSFEYDGLGDGYERLIVDEVLPAVEALKTSDGRRIRLSHSGNDRAIAGSSSGAIAGFNAAWEHPEAFSRVISAVGTYIGLRGADRFPSLIRLYEPKPLRVFLQDGSGDLNIYAGDWWMANQTMERALTFSGYEVNHVWGDGHHSGNQITAELPNALRWIWKDWPKAIGNQGTQNGALKALLVPDESWKPVPPGDMPSLPRPPTAPSDPAPRPPLPGGPSFDSAGKMIGVTSGQIVRQGPEGTLYLADSRGLRILAPDKTTKAQVDLPGARDLVVDHGGFAYATVSRNGQSQVVLVRPDGGHKAVDFGLRTATAVTLSPDQSLLYVADGASHWIYSYVIQADGTLTHKQRYYWLRDLDSDDETQASGMCCDKAGWLYVATDMGVQVCDQAGRVNAILPVPGGRPVSIAFGGAAFDTLYVNCSGRFYSRKLNTTAANPWDVPVLPPAPRL